MTTLLLATRNGHKVQEICALLGAGFSVRTLADFPGAPPVVEDAETFAGNATKKSVELARWLLGAGSASGGAAGARPDFVLADDSGLEVDALDGAPGVHSARFAEEETVDGGNAPDAANNRKLLRLLAAVPADRRGAQFRCVIALTPVPQAPSAPPVSELADEHRRRTEVFAGVCRGRIKTAAAGVGGFGYDPLFVPDGFEQSFAELGEAAKNSISHRGRALEQLLQRLRPAS